MAHHHLLLMANLIVMQVCFQKLCLVSHQKMEVLPLQIHINILLIPTNQLLLYVTFEEEVLALNNQGYLERNMNNLILLLGIIRAVFKPIPLLTSYYIPKILSSVL